MAFTALAKKDSWLSLHSKGFVAFTVLAKKRSVDFITLSKRISDLHCIVRKDPMSSLHWQKKGNFYRLYTFVQCVTHNLFFIFIVESSFPFSTSLVLLCSSGKFAPPPGSGLLPSEVSRAPEGWHRSRARLRIGRALIPADDSPRVFRDRLRTAVLH
ncbi:hypothetical protein CDAR_220781 [Caerostris darwini]|uniref:Uncharacterized protein n=1 Tax=Caerostris darwini TaxID=1538125 RepID=A0AAV4PFB7_9ARAC|nr:hypothetical protein CDAR_220781 [Caerostris darwini]